jgi:hypothetical protein
MRNFLAMTAAFSLFMVIFTQSAPAGYGDVTEGHPLMKERQLLVLTDACRISPIRYRDAYVGNYAILDSTKYPAVNPLYWSLPLNKSAHDHALDMGDTCGIMQHPSCNGTAWNKRINSYYMVSLNLGENIAAGNSDVFTTMNQWIMDAQQGSTQPAPDASWCRITGSVDSMRCDGHRYNIMNGQYKELGTGYAYGTNTAAKYHPFWVQDFGGGASGVVNPIAGAAHFLRETGKTTFLADYYDPSLKAPMAATLILDGQPYAMTLLMGKASRGVYQAVLMRGGVCRLYYFEFVDGNGKSRRYPEQGGLITSGEGNCAREYVPAESLSVESGSTFREAEQGRIRSVYCKGVIEIYILNSRYFPQWTAILDTKGKKLRVQRWERSSGYSRRRSPHGEIPRLIFFKSLAPGCYFLIHHISEACCIVEKVGIVK